MVALTIAQLSDAAIRDWEKRRHNLGRLNLDGIAAVLTVAGMPTASGGLKLDAANQTSRQWEHGRRHLNCGHGRRR